MEKQKTDAARSEIKMTSDRTSHPESPKTPFKVQPDMKDETANPKKAETGGPKGLEPTRYGDWERNGKCVDF